MYLDEVQLIDGWESLVHRLAETREIELFVSGSSAKLLSREVATASRGRLLEVLVHPFGFREALRHSGQEPTVPWPQISSADRAALERALRDYLQVGGFPVWTLEAGGRRLDTPLLSEPLEPVPDSAPREIECLRHLRACQLAPLLEETQDIGSVLRQLLFGRGGGRDLDRKLGLAP